MQRMFSSLLMGFLGFCAFGLRFRAIPLCSAIHIKYLDGERLVIT